MWRARPRINLKIWTVIRPTTNPGTCNGSRLADGQSKISQGHFCNTGNSGTGRFTNIDFNKGFFDPGNHDTCQLGLGTNTQSMY